MIPLTNMLYSRLFSRISLVGLLETKVKIQQKNSVLRSIVDWKCLDNYDFAMNGRIWLIWDETKVKVSQISHSDQFIHCHVTLLDLNISFQLIVIYAWNTARMRNDLWQSLRQLSRGISEPWVLMGDLNTTLFYDERIKNGHFVDCNISELQTVVHDLELLDMKYTGIKYTGCNNHEIPDRLYCKLDRVLVNSHWFSAFDQVESQFLPYDTSDHSPCIIRMGPMQSTGNHIFRYCNISSKDENFSSIVNEAWRNNFTGTPMYIFTRKMKLVKKGLKNLHRSSYARIGSRVSSIKTQLDRIQQDMLENPMNAELVQQEKQLRIHYENMVRNEVQMLKQRTKLHWLQKSDMNTSFFHAKLKEKVAQS